MKKLLVLVGLQGAGKTTVLNSFKGGRVLTPSTTRKPRFSGENEYHFENGWNSTDFAWEIDRGAEKYGMRWQELKLVENVGLTVFDPASLPKLKASGAKEEFEIFTVGLNTIRDLAEQHARVGNDPKRMMQQADFDLQKDVISRCDVTLSGNSHVILGAVEELAKIVGGRGGVLHSESIEKLIDAGSLMEGVDKSQIQPASYDLRIADEYWCQGNFHTLNPSNRILRIPPYSFVIVQAAEVAKLPSFISASFDIRVSLFFSGVVLSNGPQVDPGYNGALFCMLHNASGSEVGINQGDHFATIQFQTMATNGDGYKSQYQYKKNFKDFLNGSDATRPGGRIFEDVSSLSGKLEERFEKLENKQLTMTTIALAIVAIIAGAAVWFADKARDAAEDASKAAETTNNLNKQLEETIKKVEANLTKESVTRKTQRDKAR